MVNLLSLCRFMKNKILFTRPYSSQISPIIDAIKIDDFFVEGENYEIYREPMHSKNKMTIQEFNEFKMIVCDINPKNITGFDYPNAETNPNQIMIQLTHGVWLKEPNKYLFKDVGNISYILSPNKFSTNLYKKMGYAKKEILNYGFFRKKYYNDLDKIEIRKKISSIFPLISLDEKITLFAPSWIGDFGKSSNSSVDYSLNNILEQVPNDNVLLVSSHSLMKSLGNINYTFDSKWKDKVFILDREDVGLNGEMVMTVCDEIWTDFSSIIFDYADLKGWERCNWYSPITDENQSRKTRKIYYKRYKNYAKGITDSEFDLNFLKKQMRYYNSDDVNKSISNFITFLKKKLKQRL